MSGPKRENIGISPDTKRRVDLVAQIRRMTLREASEEAWGAWLALNERNALAQIQHITGSRRRAAA